MSKFKIDDEVKMTSYKGDDFYDRQVGLIPEDDLRILKYRTGIVIRNESHFYVVVRFVHKDSLSQSDWWIHEDDLELVKNETSVKIEIDASKAIEQIQAVFPTNESVTLRGCDVNFLFDQFELDNINGKKYTALLQHFIDNP